MIYCPHCNRPSARTQGPCPHCKGDLADPRRPTGVGPSPIPEDTEPTPQAPIPPDSTSDVGPSVSPVHASGLELDAPATASPLPGQVGHAQPSSGLDLDVDGDLASQFMDMPGPASSATDELHVREMAGFGPPGNGVVGTVKYWFRVRKRLAELKKQLQEAEQEGQTTTSAMHIQCTELGRKGHALGLTDPVLDPLMSKALLADAELKSHERRRLSLASEHQATMKPIEAELKQIEAEAQPIREQERDVIEELTGIQTDRKRVEAKLKRAQIELRNADDLIKKRRDRLADPNFTPAERQKLEIDIGALEDRRTATMGQILKIEESLAVFAEPIAAVETRLGEIRGRLSEKLEKISALTNDLKRLAKDFSNLDSEVARQVESETEKVTAAWTAVGQQIVSQNVDNPALADLKKSAATAIYATAEAKRTIALIERAQISYDQDVVARAKKIALVAGIAAAALIAIAIGFGF
ncbi:MAG: hypothetical protein QNJ97_16255 [Myxococcota bacterium]|nr:hypothetical protein [Myxococcota bacterium]